MKDAKELAEKIASIIRRGIEDSDADYIGAYRDALNEAAAILAQDREEVRAEERATIMAEVQDGGKSCHWCRSAIVAEERKACAERALKFVESMLSDADMDRLYAAILADEPSHD